MSARDENKEVVRRFVLDAFVPADLELMEGLLHPEYVDHMPFPGQSAGRAGYFEKVAYIRSVLPDLSIGIDLLTADGDLVTEVWTATATHSGADFLGAPPSGRRLEFRGIDVFRVEDGRITEIWHVEDFYSALIQTGFIEPPG